MPDTFYFWPGKEPEKMGKVMSEMTKANQGDTISARSKAIWNGLILKCNLNQAKNCMSIRN